MKKAIAFLTALCIMGVALPSSQSRCLRNDVAAAESGDTDNYYHDYNNGIVYTAIDDNHAKVTDLYFYPAEQNPSLPNLNPSILSNVIINKKGFSVTNLDIYMNYLPYESIDVADSITRIHDGCFSYNPSLKSVHLSDSLPVIPEDCFSNCSGLLSVKFPSELKTISNRAFYFCSSLNGVTLPSGLKTILDSAFYGCKDLSLIQLPNSIETLGSWVFAYCDDLKTVELPDSINSIGSFLFAYSGIENVKFPSNYNSIPEAAFYNCLSIKSFDIPDTINIIDGSAFGKCENLTEVTIPDSVTTIRNSVFSDCTNLRSVTIPDSVISIGSGLFYRSGIESVVLPKNITELPKELFFGCKSLKEFKIPETIKLIDESAFSQCEKLSEVTIPDSVSKIGREAFSYCSSLESVSIPKSVKSIGIAAFKDCSELESITFLNPDCIIGDEELSYFDNSQTISNSNGGFTGTIYGYNGSTAQEYAEKHGYKFKSISDNPDVIVTPGTAIVTFVTHPTTTTTTTTAVVPNSPEEDQDPIIIIPGIMGSRLFKDEIVNDKLTDCIWPPDIHEVPTLEFMQSLAIQNQLYVRPPVNITNLQPGDWELGAQDNLSDLVYELHNSFPNRDIYVFSYDWRKSNKESADLLDEFIQSLGTEKVDIVAHSMGGIVTSKYIKRHGTMKLDKIITCGTPYEGSVEAIDAVVNFEVLRGDKETIDNILGVFGLNSYIKNRFPGIAELTPTQNYYNRWPMYRDNQSDPISFAEYQEKLNSIFYKSVYSDAYDFQQSLHNENTDYNVLLGYDKSYFLVGTGKYTLRSVKFDSWLDDIDNDTFADEFSDVYYTNAGDGTVPLYSGTISEQIATLEPGRYKIVASTHLGLIEEENDNPNFDNFIWIENILRNKDDDQLEPAYSYAPYTTYGIYCPVDVEIGSGNDKLCSAEDDISLRSSFGRLDIIGRNNDIKMICMDEDTNLDINLTGTDTGTMDFKVSHFSSSNELLDERIFEDVPLTDKTVIKTKADNKEVTVLSVDHDGDGVVDETWTAKKNETVTTPDAKINITTTATSASAISVASTKTGSATVTTPVTTTKPQGTSEPEYTFGDVNDDGKIDATDATLVLVNYSLLSTGEKMQLTESQQKAADVNGDGKIDASDATMILQYYSYLSTGGDLVFKEFMKQNG